MVTKTDEMVKYDLYKLLKEELGNGSNNLVTRPSGQALSAGGDYCRLGRVS